MALKPFDELGLELWVENDQLKVSGMSSIPEGVIDEMRRYIRDHKAEIISQISNISKAHNQIQRMEKCLHQRRCEHLCSNPPARPLCAVTGEAIFDMNRCPKNLWR